MCPPLFGWLVGKSELTDGVVDIEVWLGSVEGRSGIRHGTLSIDFCLTFDSEGNQR